MFTLAASVGFLFLSLIFYNQHAGPTEGLVRSLLVALSFAIFLNIYSLWRLHKEHREADCAFRNTDCESSSIFLNVLDGILIVNNEGDCLDANPAAAAILRTSTNKLLGQSIGHFLADHDEFRQKWSSFLQNTKRRGRVKLTASDGATLFVDYAATANYLPGRHVLILSDVTEHTRAELSLKKSEERFRFMADNIQEAFWMMDARTQEVAYVNPAYATITGYSVETLQENPSSYRELIYPDDRVRILSRLDETVTSGTFDEEFRFIRADGDVRWIWVKGFAAPAGQTQWLVGTAQDITSRKQAEMKISEQLDAVEAARSEAEALRKATLALSQNLAMDAVLDTLLQCISELVPFDRGAVFFVEGQCDLMLARETPHYRPNRAGLIVNASENSFFQKILFEHRAVLLPDVFEEHEWKDHALFDRTHSWLGIPLAAGGRVLGILSLSADAPSAFTTEHLRVAKSLGVSAAVAIQNARVHERAEIYAAELKFRLRELHDTQTALQHAINAPTSQ